MWSSEPDYSHTGPLSPNLPGPCMWVFRGEAEQVEVNSHSHSSGMATRRMSLKVNGSQLVDQGGLGIYAQKDHGRIKLDSLFGSQLV